MSAELRVLVCGDRNWDDPDLIREHLEDLAVNYSPITVIEGGARGADRMAAHAARFIGLFVEEYPAKWDEHGRAAGPIRNTQMLRDGKPDMVLAFHDAIDESKGTKNMIRQAKKAGVPVTLVTHGDSLKEEPGDE